MLFACSTLLHLLFVERKYIGKCQKINMRRKTFSNSKIHIGKLKLTRNASRRRSTERAAEKQLIFGKFLLFWLSSQANSRKQNTGAKVSDEARGEGKKLINAGWGQNEPKQLSKWAASNMAMCLKSEVKKPQSGPRNLADRCWTNYIELFITSPWDVRMRWRRWEAVSGGKKNH